MLLLLLLLGLTCRRRDPTWDLHMRRLYSGWRQCIPARAMQLLLLWEGCS